MSGADIRAGGAFIEVVAKNESLKKGLDESKKLLSNFRQSVDRVGSLTGRLFGGGSSAIRNGIQSTFSGIGAALEKGFQRGITGSRLFVESIRGVELKMRNFSVSARNLGLDLIKLGVVLGTPIAIGVKQFADFEKALAKVSTFLAEPAKLMPQFKEDILALSEQFGTSATDIAEGLSEILSAGIPASKAMSFVKDSLKGSIGNVVAFKDQMSLLVTVMQAYEGSNLTTAKATEILRVIVEKGRIPADQLAQSFGQVVSGAANAGVSFEETAAAMSAMSLTGLTVAEQTTALNGVLNSFSSAAPESAEAFLKLNKALGNSDDPMTIATLRTKGLTKVLEELSALSPDDLGAIFKETRAGRGITILVAKMKEYKDALAQARSGGNLADTALEKMLKTVSHLGDQLLQVGKNLAISIGDVLLESLTKAAHALMDLGKLISSFIKENPALVLTMTKVAAAVLAAGGAFVAMGLSFSVISTVLSGFVAIGSFVIDAIVAIGSALAGLFLFFTSGTGIVVALGVALISTFVDFGEIFGSIVNGVKSQVSGLLGFFDNFKNGIVETFGLVKRAIAAKDYDLAVRIVVNKIKLIWFETVDAIKNKYEELKTSFMDKLNEMRIFVIEFVQKTLNQFSELSGLTIFENLGTLFADAFSDMDGTLEGFAKTWIHIWSTMQEFSLAVIKTVQDGWSAVQKAHYQDVISTWSKTEGEIADARSKVAQMIGGDKSAMQTVNSLLKTTENIERLQALLKSGVSDDRKKQIESQIKEDEGFLASSRSELNSKIGLFSKPSFLSAFDTGFKPRAPDLVEAAAKLSALENNDSIRGANFQDAFAKIEAAKNKSISEKNQKSKADAEAERLQKLNESFGNTDFSKRKIPSLLREQQQLAEETKGKEQLNAFLGIVDLFKKGVDSFIADISPIGDAIVGNDKKDQDIQKTAEKSLRDGIMGAFNTNALGDFSKGDVQKSQLDLLKEINDKLEKQEKPQKDAVLNLEQIRENTKEPIRFK